ncbi:hypothetical protein FUAX_55430 (plasmid) [Fulvitalea axinellae]|uniref:Lipoprotein n=1 Tax=Fulvitalea axinellae TaxID=1182444 RepID=A0AAU9CVM1_9BACT|nr:hypothetical protein FUAX_55430 [Fulvitalea axinellae]
MIFALPVYNININFMKSSFLKFFSIILCLSSFSCSNNSLEDKNTIKLTPKDFDIVGLEHNEYLDYAYSRFKEDRTFNTNRLDRKNDNTQGVRGLAIEYMKELAREKGGNIKMAEEYIENSLYVSDSWSTVEKRKQSSVAFPNPTDAFRDLVKNLDLVINQTSENNIETNIALVSDLEKRASSELSGKELYVFLTATSVTKHTSQYWNENLNKWAALSQNQKQMRSANNGTVVVGPEDPDPVDGGKFWNFMGNLVAADVKGAAVAAVSVWTINALPGGGQIAYGSAMAGGAAGNSALYIIDVSTAMNDGEMSNEELEDYLNRTDIEDLLITPVGSSIDITTLNP